MYSSVFACVLIVLAVLFNGCAGPCNGPVAGLPGAQGAQGPAGQTVSVAAPDATMTIVNQYNAYRLSVGQDPVSPGLACTLYSVPSSTTSILSTPTSSFSTTGWTNEGTFTYVGAFNQPSQPGTSGFNVLPVNLQPFYATYFVVHCTGYLAVATSGFHAFTLDSDDGSNLYVDGGLPLVNDDGLHSMASATGVKNLQANMHSFEIDYFEGPGNVGLILNEDGVLMPSEALWH